MAFLEPPKKAGRLSRAARSLMLQVSCALALLLGSAGARSETASEYQLKAVFLYNFAQFVEWPSNAFQSATSPLVIGVLGSDPFGRVLDDTVAGEHVGSRRLVIRRFDNLEQASSCHILFIARSESGRLPMILDRLRGSSILTVSDIYNFHHRGGVIGFETERNRIRLKINLDAAQANQLKLSSKLLRVADVSPNRAP